MSHRTAFVLQVRPDKLDEYVEAHEHVWPEMLDALREAGFRNYTIFRHGNEMFGYFESDDPDAAAAYMEAQEVNSGASPGGSKLCGQPDEGVPVGGPVQRVTGRVPAHDRPTRRSVDHVGEGVVRNDSVLRAVLEP
jgi:L-rhamnose mutarotase